mmetsp:Transcript_2802/g.6121  ORF Transcript_2802/g.6121 Transcript_2802/m.6121 type:complete len:423 (-) Transcript_2802:295-1563(-)
MMVADVGMLREMLASLPRAAFAFAYGSGALNQDPPIAFSPHPHISHTTTTTANPCSSSSSISTTTTLTTTTALSASVSAIKGSSSRGGSSSSAPCSGFVLSKRGGNKAKMVDFIVAVEDPASWHEENMTTCGNTAHYSSLMRALGPRACARLQDAQHFGARMYFNTLVPFRSERPQQQLFKYGVISTTALAHDIKHWSWLYAAGRLQKPVRILTRNTQLERLNKLNIENAARAALLTLPETFREEDMYVALASLSYTGDVRMAVRAEDCDKTRHIVRGNPEGFRALYTPAVRMLTKAGMLCRASSCSTEFHQPHDVDSRARLLGALPERFLRKLAPARAPNTLSSCELAREIAQRGPLLSRKALLDALKSVVRASSLQQSVKGALTAGIVRSVKYAAAKFAAGRASFAVRAAAAAATASVRS